MKKLILAIESSCDDSSIAIISIDDYKCIFHKKLSQESEHENYGGVVPELAARLHATALPQLLKLCKPYFKDLVAVAVTCTPGLSVSLLSGISMAKTISLELKIPLIGVNHLLGHVYSLFIDEKKDFKDLAVLLVSGGHTMVLDLSKNKPVILSKSLDDSFGESFDKTAKLLGMGYPGGVRVQELALKAREKSMSFTLPMRQVKSYDYSFSGLKNQVRLKTLEYEKLELDIKSEIAFAFEETATQHIIHKLDKLLEYHSFKTLGLVGGAGANLKLRSKLKALCEAKNMSLKLASLEFCSDNALMIARAAIEQYKDKDFSSFKDELLFYNNLSS